MYVEQRENKMQRTQHKQIAVVNDLTFVVINVPCPGCFVKCIFVNSSYTLKDSFSWNSDENFSASCGPPETIIICGSPLFQFFFFPRVYCSPFWSDARPKTNKFPDSFSEFRSVQYRFFDNFYFFIFISQ